MGKHTDKHKVHAGSRVSRQDTMKELKRVERGHAPPLSTPLTAQEKATMKRGGKPGTDNRKYEIHYDPRLEDPEIHHDPNKKRGQIRR